MKIAIEKYEYNNFTCKFNSGACGTQRRGQAFHDHFQLDKMNNRSFANMFYYCQDENFPRLLDEFVEFN